MLVFKSVLLILFFITNALYAKTIIGKVRVIDGDTIDINSKKIRLHGIDAPETEQNCIFKKKKWPSEKKSASELKKLINNQVIKCEINDIDIYNRYVAICSSNELNINQIMVKKGWALAYRYYSTDYIISEKYARENKLGIWRGKFETPYLFRQRNK